MPRYELRQMPGPRARARRRVWHDVPHWKLVADISAPSATAALEEYVQDRYVRSGHRQYAGHHVTDFGRAVVTLANGRAVHEVVVEAVEAWPA